MKNPTGQQDVVYPVSWKIVAILNAWVNFLAFILCILFIYALLKNKETRNNAYNLYVVFLVLPDALNTMLNGIFLILVGGYNRQLPTAFSWTYTFFFFFYYIANCFLNALVAYEINKLVVDSYQRRKTAPPTRYKACKQAMAVYLMAILVATWYALPVQWSPFHTVDAEGGSISTFGSPDGGPISPTVATAISFSLLLFPTIYVLYVRIRLSVKKLLPSTGRTRVLSMFFMRIIVVFLAFYIPNTTLSAISSKESDRHSAKVFWMEETRSLFFALQAFATLYMVSQKEDIFKALIESKTGFGSLSGSFSVGISILRSSISSEWQQPDVYDAKDSTTEIKKYKSWVQSESQEVGDDTTEAARTKDECCARPDLESQERVCNDEAENDAPISSCQQIYASVNMTGKVNEMIEDVQST